MALGLSMIMPKGSEWMEIVSNLTLGNVDLRLRRWGRQIMEFTLNRVLLANFGSSVLGM